MIEAGRPKRMSDDVAYILPMGIFLAVTAAQGKWPNYYAALYVLKAIATAVSLVAVRSHFTKIRWNAMGWGLLVGVAGTVQWIGMQLLLQKHFNIFAAPADSFNPLTHFSNPTMMISWIAVRLGTAVLVVPFMEELFWRDFLWRQILAPNDFKLASIGEYSISTLLIVSVAFATVHRNWCLTAIVWALMVGWLLIKTKSIGACIIAHAVTNLLLGVYVLVYHDWGFW